VKSYSITFTFVRIDRLSYSFRTFPALNLILSLSNILFVISNIDFGMSDVSPFCKFQNHPCLISLTYQPYLFGRSLKVIEVRSCLPSWCLRRSCSIEPPYIRLSTIISNVNRASMYWTIHSNLNIRRSTVISNAGCSLEPCPGLSPLHSQVLSFTIRGNEVVSSTFKTSSHALKYQDVKPSSQISMTSNHPLKS
jgi:hypothetical protein